jgi:hypothetical protein
MGEAASMWPAVVVVVAVDEKDAKNNHGVWYDALNLSLANFVGDKELANKIVRAAVQRLDEQMDDSGYFPLELARTTSMHYTAFILDAFTIIAQLSENTETNFWALQTTSKKSLEKGIETLVPYLSGNKKWTWQQIKPFTMSNAYPILWKASSKYNCKSCKEIIRKNERDFDRMLITLL